MEKLVFSASCKAGDDFSAALICANCRSMKKHQNNKSEDHEFAPASMAGNQGLIGSQIGPYRLLSVLGEGGFGIVYLAEQRHPLRRQVALKVIKPGMDSKQVIARFEAERQALAVLDHPNIARVFEGGTTEAGRPYFVMELVKGLPITEYCDREKLGIDERLELSKQVCNALQHAHQKGIVHRDLKPSNVLVSLQEDQATPKIIDFGVAKAIGQPLTERTLFTEQGQLFGTPEYMSPEQAGMTGQDVDTRSDIYSLGVLLYELLTGSLPFDRKTFCTLAFDEILRVIREEDPPKPSTRLSSLGEDAKEAARSRRTEVRALTKRLHNELEWIPLKAMRKHRAHRYQSASECAHDIQNYLDGNPLIAGPESATYRLRKVLGRHRAFVTGIAAVVAVLIVGIIVSTNFAIGQARERREAERARAAEEAQRKLADQALQEMKMARDSEEKQRKRTEAALEKEARARQEASQQAKIAEAVADFFTYDLLGAVDPEKLTGQDVSVSYILDAASESLGQRLQIAPLIEARIRRSIGLMYRDLGIYGAAEQNLKRALQVNREKLG
ncbi:MAG: serine/threonine-protein kinase, partial [Sedimentisphaerales bacterium]